MARQCEVCGKTAQVGNQVTTRGKQKYLGGVGTKVTGISRRKFKPNLQRVKVSTANGTHKAVHVCTQVPPQRRGHEGRPRGTVQGAARAGEGEAELFQRSGVFIPAATGIRTASDFWPPSQGHDSDPFRFVTMSISRQDVEKVALLARLQLTEAELGTMTEQLAQIVGYVDQLAEVDTEGVEPMAHAIEVHNVFRGDVGRRRACRARKRSPTRRTTMSAAISCRPCWETKSSVQRDHWLRMTIHVLIQQTASEHLRSLEAGAVTSVELTRAYLDRIQAVRRPRWCVSCESMRSERWSERPRSMRAAPSGKPSGGWPGCRSR